MTFKFALKSLLTSVTQTRRPVMVALILSSFLAACSAFPEVSPQATNEPEERESIFGPGGLTFGGDQDNTAPEATGGIGVNSFLWRASLDTVAFMPLSSADPFGGVILTDWYSPPGTPNERFKVTVYILDRRLRADALKSAVFRQIRRDTSAGWEDAAVEANTATELEDAILTRARQLRISFADEQ